jgi:hypothetical protein
VVRLDIFLLRNQSKEPHQRLVEMFQLDSSNKRVNQEQQHACQGDIAHKTHPRCHCTILLGSLHNLHLLCQLGTASKVFCPFRRWWRTTLGKICTTSRLKRLGTYLLRSPSTLSCWIEADTCLERSQSTRLARYHFDTGLDRTPNIDQVYLCCCDTNHLDKHRKNQLRSSTSPQHSARSWMHLQQEPQNLMDKQCK